MFHICLQEKILTKKQFLILQLVNLLESKLLMIFIGLILE